MSKDPSATKRSHPPPRITFEPCAKRVRVVFNGETVADSTKVHLLHESGHVPVYYFPPGDLRRDLLVATSHSTHCPFKGEASYWNVSVAGKTAENAVWSYRDPLAEVAEIQDYLAFYWERMDQWFEEDEEVFVHARDPYRRIDILPSSRPLRVVLGGETLAETRRALFLFETGLPTRYYIPPEDVRLDLLEPSKLTTACPYKGRARYWSARAGGRLHENIAWSYPDPVRESTPIKGYVSFFDEKVDQMVVDGEELPRPQTKWS